VSDALNSAIELHDSTIESVVHVGQQIRVAFHPAYVHKSAGIPGIDPGSGYVQDFIFEFSAGRIEAGFGTLPAEILHGELFLGDQKVDNMVNLPCEIIGSVSLHLNLGPDYRKATVSGSGLKVIQMGEAAYVEEFHQ
jgi:hypothetical protein